MNNQLMHEQDEHIEEIHQLASKMKKQGHEINRQLGRQDQLIKNLDE